MKKYIFLDIDGVISTQKTRYELDPEKQQLLGIILKETEADIILTSSWRMLTLKETKQYMQEKGFLFIDKITGQTIRAYHYLDKAKKIVLDIPRGVEIKQYIDNNVHSNNGKDYNRLELYKDSCKVFRP